ncbi:hypothetical protein A3Q56_06351 [Intoshia linei]|uniref:Uncharacterized protein n=1 Tax=Intoshia linei TaxID=1819745 RepID=A0A177AWT8_9BILA|nr:hypothetical protein A3Q56_06351 [Intoshia linei]
MFVFKNQVYVSSLHFLKSKLINSIKLDSVDIEFLSVSHVNCPIIVIESYHKNIYTNSFHRLIMTVSSNNNFNYILYKNSFTINLTHFIDENTTAIGVMNVWKDIIQQKFL